MMAQIVYFKEWLIVFYKKHVDVVLPVLKLVFAFFTMCMFQGMFPYNMVINKPGIFLVLSAAQAFLPISVLYYMISILIMINLWKVSMDIFLGFVIFSIICSLAFVRVDRKHAVILIVTAVMFYLKLEYLLPVLLGMIVGFGAILPAAAGSAGCRKPDPSPVPVRLAICPGRRHRSGSAAVGSELSGTSESLY